MVREWKFRKHGRDYGIQTRSECLSIRQYIVIGNVALSNIVKNFARIKVPIRFGFRSHAREGTSFASN
jgi:hypothetical protein